MASPHISQKEIFGPNVSTRNAEAMFTETLGPNIFSQLTSCEAKAKNH